MNQNPMYELHNVSKSYGDNKVVQNFNLTIYQGQLIAITGKSGSGKTTLMNLLGMLESPDTGTLKFKGIVAPKLGSREQMLLLRNNISYLFQNFALIENDPVGNNLEVALAYSKKSKNEKKHLKTAALEKVGLNIPFNKKVYELSGGEQQRLALARILLKPSDVILADEPTGSLDSMNRNFVLNALHELHQQGKTVIIVTHDEFVAEQCEQMIKL
ncbi:putative ABC transport system ATP-binding protein [Paenibacillus sp. JGP012]|nr:putative ABC transport system ATP-binding protein [Paenibacillus sp. JGP012]